MKKLKLNKLLYSFVFSVLAASFIATPITYATNAGQVGTWGTSTSLPAIKGHGGVEVYNGRIYIIGGWNGSSDGTNTVMYATLNSNGTVGSWTTSGNTLPQSVRVNNSATYNGYLYSVGGLTNVPSRLNTVSYAAVNNDGSVGTWSTSGNTLPTDIQQSGVFAYDGYLYVVGGSNALPQSAIYYAPLANDGSVGTWSTNPTPLPAGRSVIHPVVYNGRVYVVGGSQAGSGTQSTVYYATINANHSIGSWTTSPNSLPEEREGAGTVEYGGYIYVIGGASSSFTRDTIFYSQIKADGSIGPWITSGNTLPAARANGFSVAYNGYAYMIGGQDNINFSHLETYYAPLTAATRTATLTNPVTSKPIVISTPTGTDLTCSSAGTETSLATADSIYDYPVGLASFCYTTNATSNQVTVTFVTDLSPSKVIARHYNSTTHTYTTISDATITSTTYGGQPALNVTYTIDDNGPYDTDATVGSVSDPVGITNALEAPNTGFAPQQPNILTNALTVALIGGSTLVVALIRRSYN